MSLLTVCVHRRKTCRPQSTSKQIHLLAFLLSCKMLTLCWLVHMIMMLKTLMMKWLIISKWRVKNNIEFDTRKLWLTPQQIHYPSVILSLSRVAYYTAHWLFMSLLKKGTRGKSIQMIMMTMCSDIWSCSCHVLFRVIIIKSIQAWWLYCCAENVIAFFLLSFSTFNNLSPCLSWRNRNNIEKYYEWVTLSLSTCLLCPRTFFINLLYIDFSQLSALLAWMENGETPAK